MAFNDIGGEEELTLPGISEGEILVIRSARRKRNISAYRQGGRIIVSIPARMSKADERAIVPEMIAKMADQPIIFAMANPDPEITPEEVAAVRSDAIVATGRSDYPNQVNNVLGFPYIFRGALDVRARRINMEMKIACARALAALAREDVPDEVAAAYRGRKLKFGPDYIIPTPFDPRLIWYIPPFVAQAAMDSGVATRPIADMDAYVEQLAQYRIVFRQQTRGGSPGKLPDFADHVRLVVEMILHCRDLVGRQRGAGKKDRRAQRPGCRGCGQLPAR